MSDFKRPIGTTRWTRLQEENETLRQARDRALELAAKNRLVAETALVALLPSLDVSHCDAEDLQAIQDFVMATDHLKEMNEAELLTLIRSLLESMDSEELHYVRTAHRWNDCLCRIVSEKTRLIAINRLVPLGVFDAGYTVGAIELIDCILYGLWSTSPSQKTATDKGLEEIRINAEIDQIFREESSENAQQNQAPEVSAVQQSVES